MNAEAAMNTHDGLGAEPMSLADLLDKYKNGRRVRERRYSWEAPGAAREGEIEGTSLGGARVGSPKCGNDPMLNVHVKWDDGTDSTSSHTAFEVVE